MYVYVCMYVCIYIYMYVCIIYVCSVLPRIIRVEIGFYIAVYLVILSQ